MSDKNEIIAKQWLEKADKDLEIAQLLIKKGDRFVDFTCFHCQQAFEKYLKALLLSNGIKPEKTHNLEKLINQTLTYHLGLMKWVDAAREISPFAIVPRYPDEIMDVPLNIVKGLIKKTKKLGEFIKELIK